MSRKRGRNASRNGLFDELSFSCLLESAGYAESRSKSPTIAGTYSMQAPFSHPWKLRGRADFCIRTFDQRLVLVQNKNQDVNGTADEKIPFQFDIARWTWPDFRFDEFWLVLGGHYWRTDGGKLRVDAFRMKSKETEALLNFRARFLVYLSPSKELAMQIRETSE